ncbi:MAG TPA: hypothetical protein VHQ65_03010, partial [Thermoanaerobaculia bacterium]|nr:hypothetical protein [Thermoanaerobaculia bacterium]
PVGDADVEEGGHRGRWLLVAVLLLAAAVAGWLLFGPVGGGAERSGEPPAVTEPAREEAASEGPGDAAGTAAGVPLPVGSAPAEVAAGTTSPIDLEAMAEAELARQEQALEEKMRRENESRIRQLEAELARIRESAARPQAPAELEPAAEGPGAEPRPAELPPPPAEEPAPR